MYLVLKPVRCPFKSFKVLVSKTDEIVFPELPVEVVQGGPLWGEASQLVRPVAISSVGVGQKQRRRVRIIDIRRVTHILIPSLPRHVPRGVSELVIPSGIVSRQVVIALPAVVEGVRANVNVVAALRPVVHHASVACQLRAASPGRFLAADRQADLSCPVIAPLDRRIDAGLGIAILGICQRVTIGVIIRR